jgi:isoleucyl-tRNA synthetase
VQQARKDAGLNVADRIALSLVAPEKLNTALDLFGEYIAEQTLAVSLDRKPLAEHSFSTTQELEGHSVTIQLKKAA